MINLEVINKLSPCKDRLDNYIQHYGDKEFTKRQFLGLKNITHEDKLWVAFRLMDTKAVTLSAASIAESVLHIYESQYPNDLRPRKAIEAARDYVNGKITKEQLLKARDAAYAAAHAAAAHAAAASSSAAYYAASYAYAAAHAAAYYAAATARKSEEKAQRTIILKLWKE